MIPKLFTFPMVLVALLVCACIRTSDSYNVKAWQSTRERVHYPDFELRELKSRPNTGLSFSGGGSRAYINAVGILAGLHQLNLIEDIRYIIGVSGGSWATAVYSYYQHQNVSDSAMLGEVVLPEDIVFENLTSDMTTDCIRSYTNVDNMKGVDISNPSATKIPKSALQLRSPLSVRANEEADEDDSIANTDDANYDEDISFEVWTTAVQATFLEPAGIVRGIPCSWSDATVDDIKTRNPQLADVPFLTVRQKSKFDHDSPQIDARPFPLFGTTLVGPLANVPYTPDRRNYSILEFTPLSVGVLYTQEMDYSSADSSTVSSDAAVHQRVGGLVEPFAFGGVDAPLEGLRKGQRFGFIEVPDFANQTAGAFPSDVNVGTSSSSYYPGTYVASLNASHIENMSAIVQYWSPAASAATADSPQDNAGKFIVADGGGLQVDNMISLIQRGVTNVILVCSTSVPLQPKSKWNPATDELSEWNIDYDIPSFFGVIPSDIPYSEQRYYDLTTSQIFPTSEWIPLAERLQQAQEEGNGIVVTSELTTIRNDFYGIAAGLQVNVTWMYLGRLSSWEALLSDEMRAMVVPPEDPSDLSNLIDSGPFSSFPNYPTLFSNVNYERANLLADLAGWSVLQNEELFRSVLGDV